MKKILILGDIEQSAWHSFEGVDQALTELLESEYEVVCTEDYSKLNDLSEYDLFVSYADRWQNYTLTDDEIVGIMNFVANGKNMLVLHGGIGLQSRKEFIHIVGGKFSHHPKIRTLTTTCVEGDEITEGVKPFEAFDEPYHYEMDSYSEVTPLAHYDLDGVEMIAAWKKKYGKGEVVYLMNGHRPEVFRIPEYSKLIKNAVKYLTK